LTKHDATSATHSIAGAFLTIGNDPDSVAEVMRTYGCCGTANSPGDNPITTFLARFGIRGAEIAWNGRGYICRSGEYEQDVLVALPDPVAMFVEQFDAGRWPELDANSNA